MLNRTMFLFDQLAIKDLSDYTQTQKQKRTNAISDLSIVAYQTRDQESGFRKILLPDGTQKNVRSITNSEPSDRFSYNYIPQNTASSIGTIDNKPA